MGDYAIQAAQSLKSQLRRSSTSRRREAMAFAEQVGMGRIFNAFTG
jgi:hypothetical protein